MQDDLLKLNLWESESNMVFNQSKFKWLQYGKNLNLKEDYNYISPDQNDVLT